MHAFSRIIFSMSVPLILPLIIAIAIFVGAIVFLLVHRFSGPRVTAPSCGNCLYNITGLVSEICPECGSRLSEVGILHPDSRRPIRRIGWIIVWTCTLGPIALIANPIIQQQIPRKMILQGSRQFSQPTSGAYQSITITGDLAFRAPRQPATPVSVRAPQLMLTLTLANGSTSSMIADFDSMICSFKDGAGKQVQRPLSFAGDHAIQVVLEWYAANQIPTSASTVRWEAAEIAIALATHERFRAQTTAGLNPPNYFGGTIQPYSTGSFSSSSFDSSKPFQKFTASTAIKWAADPWPPRLLIAGWAVVWMLGVGLIFLLRRRKPAAVPGASAPYTSPTPYESTLQTDSSSA